MDLIIKSDNLPGTYQGMLQKIDQNMPAIKQAQGQFYKTQSQFMDNMLTVSHPTHIRNLRQILAEINKSKQALDQAYLKNKKKGIKIQIKLKKIEDAIDPLEKDLLRIEIVELETQIASTEDYMQGAVRKISAYIEQYNSILKHIGKETITEADFEREESRYHIGKAFEQALIAARARGGMVDEGNHIYFQQIGINGAMAQEEITAYLVQESQLFEDGKAPTHEMTLRWLNALMDKYESCPAVFAEKKGMTLTDKTSLIGESNV
jgi:hypothetical protein